MTSTPPPGQQPPHNPDQGQPNQPPNYGQPNQTPSYNQPNQTPSYGQPNQAPYGQGFQQGQQLPQYGVPQAQYGGPPQRPPRSKVPWILGGLAGILGVLVLGLLAYILVPRGGSGPSPSASTVAQGSASPSASAAPSDTASPAASGSTDASAAASGSAAPSGSTAAVADGSPGGSAAASASPSASTGTGAITNLQDVKEATVQIVAQGTFRDPEQEVTNAFGSGTGFIIDSSGLAVTNNHVVTGAGTLDVFVAGETQPRGARVIAASECADLALIDIDGDNYPFLQWSETPLEPTVEVYAAGFPLGEPTYTATRGSINKVQADRATSWALVASEIVHDANINPGNSGGPLVDKDGKVVGVNYAVDKDADQNFAIAREEALRVIDELRKGTDVRSIGVNGTAIVSEDGSLSGIWVASVKSGSPADKARIRAGDIITSLEGIELATDGSMLDYCKVLRGRQPTDTLSVEVLRLDESAVYEGQLNGRELAQVTSFAQIAEENGETSEDQPVTSYSGYRTVQDDNRVIQVNIPNEWSEVDGKTWEVDGEALGVQITAAPSIQRFNETYDEPGMIFVASRAVAQVYNENEVLALFDLTADCTKTQSAQPYEDDLYTGVYDYYENCDGGTTEAVVLTFVPDTRAYVGIVAIQLTSEADYEALDQILASFEVIGTFTD